MRHPIRNTVFALFMAAAAVVPSQAFAQSCTTATAYYGELLQTADLDGNGTLDAVCNGYSEINVVSGSAATPLSAEQHALDTGLGHRRGRIARGGGGAQAGQPAHARQA